MALTFVAASSHVINTAIGACTYTGPNSAAAIVKRASDGANHLWLRAGTGAGASWWGSVTSANKISFSNQTTQVDAQTLTLTASEGWALIAFTKAAGTTIPTFHKYVFSTNAWTHEAAATTIADPTTPGTNVRLGGGSGLSWDGDIAIEGCWNAALTNAQIESLPFSLASWFQVSPKGLWLLDQQATSQLVLDLSGGGANESSRTGTSVATASVPVFSYGLSIRRVAKQPAAAGGGAAGPRDLLLLRAG